MLRVLMVLEDYGELVFLQTMLKKTGFDVDAIQNTRGFNESLLRMNPEVLVMTGYGKRVQGLELAKQVKKKRGLPHIILLYSPGQMRESDPAVSLWLPAPVSASDLLDAIGDVCKLNKQVLQEKLQRQQAHDSGPEQKLNYKEDTGDEAMFVSGEAKSGSKANQFVRESTMSPVERDKRYGSFSALKTPDQKGFTGSNVQDQIKAVRAAENTKEIMDIETERRAVAQMLFEKKGAD